MRTTLDLPDDLLIEAKTTAARRRITLRELFTRALERDPRPAATPAVVDHFVIDEDGWPVLKRNPNSNVIVTSEMVRELMDREVHVGETSLSTDLISFVSFARQLQ